MKLYVDDLRKCPDGWHLARTVTEAIRVLATMPVEEVSLDHDISHAVEVNGLARPYPCGETFEPVAWYLREMAQRQNGREQFGPRRIVLHTANAIGAEKMRNILYHYYDNIVIKLGSPVNGLEEKAGDGG